MFELSHRTCIILGEVIGITVAMLCDKYAGQYQDLFYLSDVTQWLVYLGYWVEPSYVDPTLENVSNINRDLLQSYIRQTLHSIHAEKGILSFSQKCYWDSWQNCTIVCDSIDDNLFDTYLRLIYEKIEYCSTDKLQHISKQLEIFLKNIT